MANTHINDTKSDQRGDVGDATSRHSLAEAATSLLIALACVLGAPACDGDSSRVPGASPLEARAEGLVVTNPTSDRPWFHDFGDIPYGARPRHVYLLENREGRDVRVQDIQTVCWCTQPSAVVVHPDGSRGPASADGRGLVVPDGGKLELALVIDTKLVEKMNIDKLAVVRLRCDSSATPYLNFEAHLVVKRTFRSVPPEMDLGRVGHLSGKAGRVDCSVEIKGDASRITAIERIEGPFEATLQETRMAGETVWIVGASAPPGLPKGPISGRVLLRTEAGPGQAPTPPWEVVVRGVVVDDVVSLPSTLSFGVPQESGATKVGFDLVASAQGDRFRILETRLDGCPSEAVAFGWTPVDPDAEGRASHWRGEATLADRQSNSLQATVVLLLDHPLQHEVRIDLTAAGR